MIPDIQNSDYIEKSGKHYVAMIDEFQLRSAFQPVISLIHNRPVGYEGLVRPFYNGKGTTPDKLFSALGGNAFASELDRTCRTLHIMNAGLTVGAESNSWLFLNVDANTIMEDFYSPEEVKKAFEPMGFRPEHVVLEILEKNIEDRQQLTEFVRHYKEVGFKIALDDFGAGESNLERIHTIHPSIVKLDRSIIQDLAGGHNGVNVLKRVVSLLREMGSMVLIEGVETEEQALLVMETEADLVQGFYFSKPVLGSPPEDQGEAKRQIKKISLLQKSVARKRMEFEERLEAQLKDVFENAVACGNQGLQAISDAMFESKHVLRFYVLDHQGFQIGETVSNPNKKHADTQYHPLQKMEGACWARRDFFVQALRHPTETYFSAPYLSLPEETLSVTLSATFKDEKKRLRVLCADVDAMALNRITSKAVKKASRTITSRQKAVKAPKAVAKTAQKAPKKIQK